MPLIEEFSAHLADDPDTDVIVDLGSRTGRALYVAKHRGSACEESIWPYRIDGERGIVALS
jgi:hypothetical protein